MNLNFRWFLKYQKFHLNQNYLMNLTNQMFH